MQFHGGDRSDHFQRTQTYLVLCPTHRDDREFALLPRPGLRFIRHEYASLALEERVAPSSSPTRPVPDPRKIERILACMSSETLTGVIKTNDGQRACLRGDEESRSSGRGPSY